MLLTRSTLVTDGWSSCRVAAAFLVSVGTFSARRIPPVLTCVCLSVSILTKTETLNYWQDRKMK